MKDIKENKYFPFFKCRPCLWPKKVNFKFQKIYILFLFSRSSETSNRSDSGKFTVKPHERPIVLRKRRQRIQTRLNWSLFYYMFNKDHSKPNLIWNLKTRQELHDSLEGEIRYHSTGLDIFFLVKIMPRYCTNGRIGECC
jgi:hypothetical protein